MLCSSCNKAIRKWISATFPDHNKYRKDPLPHWIFLLKYDYSTGCIIFAKPSHILLKGSGCIFIYFLCSLKMSLPLYYNVISYQRGFILFSRKMLLGIKWWIVMGFISTFQYSMILKEDISGFECQWKHQMSIKNEIFFYKENLENYILNILHFNIE